MVAQTFGSTDEQERPQSVTAVGFVVASCADEKLIIDTDIVTLDQAGTMLAGFDEQRKRSSIIIPVAVTLEIKSVFDEIIREMQRQIQDNQQQIEKHIRENN